MSTDNKPIATPIADDDAIFEGMVRASGVPVTDQERKNLRTAYSALMGMAAQVRIPGRSWEVRMMPNFTPKPPKADDPKPPKADDPKPPKADTQ